MVLRDWLYAIISIATPIVIFIIGYTRLQSKFESHEEADQKAFEQLMKHSAEFFDRITKIEIAESAQGEIVKNNTRQYEALKAEMAVMRTEIRGDMTEIKTLLRSRNQNK